MRPSPPPPGSQRAPLPAPSTAVVHLSVAREALTAQVEKQVPVAPEGDFKLGPRPIHWRFQRRAVDLSFDGDRVVLHTGGPLTVRGQVLQATLPVEVTVRAQPVITPDYQVRLQAVAAEVRTDNPLAERVAEVVGAIRYVDETVSARIAETSYDLRPMLAQAAAWANGPVALPLADHACLRPRLTQVLADATVLSGALEKNVALVVAPAIAVEGASGGGACAPDARPPSLPLLENVPSLAPGPFRVTLPIAIDYEVAAREFGKRLFPGGRRRSDSGLDLYYGNPRLYGSSGEMVLVLHLSGHAGAVPVDAELYLFGHPRVENRVFSVPDLDVTEETRNFLLNLVQTFDRDWMRDQARQQLTFDLGPVLDGLTEKLSRRQLVGDVGCFTAAVDHVDPDGAVLFHDGAMEVTVQVTAHAAFQAPCPTPRP